MTPPKKTAKKAPKSDKRVTRYSYQDELEPRTPETGHTSLLPPEERVVSLPMDNGWTEAIDVGKLEDHDAPAIVDLDPVLDPVLFWSGKRSHREVPVLPLQRNEVISESRIARIIERAREAAAQPESQQQSLFSNLEKSFRESDRERRVEFYTHEEGWKNKLICGDSLPVMESLLRYENLGGKVQMMFVDPPYGIKYNSNFQQRVDSTKNDEKLAADDVLTIKAFHDTWALGIHSYLSYLGERLYLMRELLALTGSIFVQISLDNAHLVRLLMDEVFGRSSYVSQIAFLRAAGRSASVIDDVYDVLLWYCRDRESFRANSLFRERTGRELGAFDFVELADGSVRQLAPNELESDDLEGRRFMHMDLTSQGESATGRFPVKFQGSEFIPRPGRHWSTTPQGIERLIEAGRVRQKGKNIFFKR